MDPVLELERVTIERSSKTILGPLNWTIAADQRWVVLGPNGAGKSTLLAIASLHLHPTSGTVSVTGQKLGECDTRLLRASIGFSAPSLARRLRPQLSASEIVQCGLHGALEPWWHTYSEQDRISATTALNNVGLDGFDNTAFSILSSGERQRVLLARSLVQEPSILLLDEPTAGLDIAGRDSLLEALDAIAARNGPSWAMVSHRIEDIPTSATHCLLLAADKSYVAGPIESTLTTQNLERSLGISLRVERLGDRWASAPVAVSP